MKLLYMGTGAAEGIPGTFCNCRLCREAKKLGGRNIRTRSQALIDGKILIDFPPDTYAHYLAYEFDLPSIRHIFVTHSHMDHFFPTEFMLRREGFIHPPIELLHLYGNKTVEEAFLSCLKRIMGRGDENFSFHPLVPFVPVDLEGYKIHPLKAKHDPKEECLIYGVECQGRALLYANDTGFFPDTTWDYLKSAKVCFDLVSLDCTMMQFSDGNNHMGIPDAVKLRQELYAIGAASQKTVFVLNHFSHNGGWNHSELCKEAEKQGFQVSYDGMEISV